MPRRWGCGSIPCVDPKPQRHPPRSAPASTSDGAAVACVRRPSFPCAVVGYVIGWGVAWRHPAGDPREEVDRIPPQDSGGSDCVVTAVVSSGSRTGSRFPHLRGNFGGKRKSLAADAPSRCPTPELAPAAVAPAASPAPAATVAPAVGSGPLSATTAAPLSRRRCHLAPPRRCATAAHHRHRRSSRRRRRFRHCASSSSYLWSRARGAPWEEVLEGHGAVIVVRISIAIRFRLSA